MHPSLVRHTFGFPFCQRLWDLKKRQDDIVLADMVDDIVANIEIHKLADIVADMKADKKMADIDLDMVADMEVDKVPTWVGQYDHLKN